MDAMKQFGITLLMVVLTGQLIGCATSKTRQNFAFDYESTGVEPGSAEISFAILDFFVEIESTPEPSIRQSNRNPKGESPLFNTLSRSIERDFQELLSTYGYGIKGPFPTYDDMTYPDKEQSDMILLPGIKILFSQSINWQDGYKVGSNSSVTVDMSFFMVMLESLTKERLWVKDITLEPVTVTLPYKVFGVKYGGVPSLEVLLAYEDDLYAALGSHLSREYNVVLSRMSSYLHPKEMEIVKNAAMRVREKKVY